MDSDKPIELALGYRGLALDIINEFIFAEIPDSLRGLQNERFRNPLAMSTYYSFDWTMWLMRNFPLTIYLHDMASYLPSCLKFGYEQRNVMMEVFSLQLLRLAVFPSHSDYPIVDDQSPTLQSFVPRDEQASHPYWEHDKAHQLKKW